MDEWRPEKKTDCVSVVLVDPLIDRVVVVVVGGPRVECSLAADWTVAQITGIAGLRHE